MTVQKGWEIKVKPFALWLLEINFQRDKNRKFGILLTNNIKLKSSRQ